METIVFLEKNFRVRSEGTQKEMESRLLFANSKLCSHS